ncbi:MAG: 1-aminocyclopropane-1-carboxylate deaminase/D-cysteine desulfhydrase [Flammeovirgaceae bacterium]
MRGLSYQKTHIQEIVLSGSGVKLFLKREDLNHPFVSGNKWWKLKYNLEEAVRFGHQTLLTFGGAYSNHIFATAAAGKELGLKTVGVIRGEKTPLLNHTLTFAESCGMELHYISREEYRKKTAPDFIQQLQNLFGDFYLIPEGGTNELAIKGCAEWALKFEQETNFDYVCLAVGTGGTMAGLINGLSHLKKVIGFPVLKGAQFLEGEIEKQLNINSRNWSLAYDYHFGGYGKSNSILENFITEIKAQHELPLDKVYTGKMLYGVLDLIRNRYFSESSNIFVLHTGGLQANYL